MNIFLLTSVYPSDFSPKGTTPVVYYFAREWVAAGHTVHVFHTESVFPGPFYLLGKLFGKFLYSRLGFVIPTRIPKEYDEVREGVNVTHVSLKKIKPHGRFSKKQVQRAFDVISSCIGREGVPDCFAAHWDNPQLELLQMLKAKYHRPTSLVYHDNRFTHLYGCYGEMTDGLVNDVDLVGFRNVTARAAYEKLFGKPASSFIAASGVSKAFIEAGRAFEREIKEVNRFVYVGALIRRKHPVTVIESLYQSYRQKPFEMTYIGEGDDRKLVQQRFDALGCNGKLTFTGRIPRDGIMEYLKRSEVLVMVSEGAIFGLVYLEAMAFGCITIAARHEGVDGIIEDGVNGFLCEAGNADELASIISRIRNMSAEELGRISLKARQTAMDYSDTRVAETYLCVLKGIVK